MSYVIVGIDAGIKTGYAIVDLNGRLVTGGVEKEASDERIVQIICQEWVPVLIASDTSPPSHFVQKVASRLNLRVYAPRESLSRLEKRAIGKDIEDPHVRDAYAAAIKAYRRYQNRLRQIEAMKVRGKDELKKMVIKGEKIAGKIEDYSGRK